MMNVWVEFLDVCCKIQVEVGKIIGSLEYDVDVVWVWIVFFDEDFEQFKNWLVDLNMLEV